MIAVPCAEDVMLNYQSISWHDAAGVRKLLGLDPAPEFRAWLADRGVLRDRQLGLPDGPIRRQLVAGVAAILA